MAFNRVTELYVGVFQDEMIQKYTTAKKYKMNTDKYLKGSGYLVDNLHYEFDITRSTEFYKDSATFTIYNPNDDTVNEIMDRGASVVFKAGYSDDGLGTIFVGQIANAYNEDESNDRKLILTCNSQRGAQYPLRRVYMSAYVEEGKSYYDVLKIIADYVGVPLSGAQVLKDNKLDSGYYISGNIRDCVSNFVASHLRQIGGKLIISNNELIYLDRGATATFDTVYLTYKTGLLSAKHVRNERYQSTEDAFQENMEYYLGLKACGDPEVAKKKAEEAKIQPRNEIEFQCLIHPGINAGAPVYIDARRNNEDHTSVLGTFYVNELHFQGDNFGGNYMLTGRAFERADL